MYAIHFLYFACFSLFSSALLRYRTRCSFRVCSRNSARLVNCTLHLLNVIYSSCDIYHLLTYFIIFLQSNICYFKNSYRSFKVNSYIPFKSAYFVIVIWLYIIYFWSVLTPYPPGTMQDLCHRLISVTPVAMGGSRGSYEPTPLWKLINTIKVDVLFKLWLSKS